jgi:hypothetical protein
MNGQTMEDYRYKMLILIKIVITGQCECVVILLAIRSLMQRCPDVRLSSAHASQCTLPSSVIRQSQRECCYDQWLLEDLLYRRTRVSYSGNALDLCCEGPWFVDHIDHTDIRQEMSSCEHWNRRFESYSRNRYQRLCCSYVGNEWPCDGLIPLPKCRTTFV